MVEVRTGALTLTLLFYSVYILELKFVTHILELNIHITSLYNNTSAAENPTHRKRADVSQQQRVREILNMSNPCRLTFYISYEVKPSELSM